MKSEDKVFAILFVALSFALLGMFWVEKAYADEFNLIVHSTSKHFGADKHYNENNKSLAGEYFPEENKYLGYVAGVYQDSYYTWAKYGGILLTKKFKTGWRAGAMIGIIHSPSYNEDEASLFALPYIAYEWEYFGINTMALPSPKEDGAFTVGVQYKLRFNL